MAGNRTAFFVRRTNGMHALEDLSMGTGARFFVDSTNTAGSDAAGYGNSPDSPLATLKYAISLCTAGKGDIIYLMPGHAETLTDTVTCDINVAGAQVIGLGYGSLIPTITLGTATTATLTVSAVNVRIKNVKIASNLADVAVGMTVAATASGLVLEDCVFADGGLTKELVIAVSIAAACANVTIRNCAFYTTITDTTGGCASAIKILGASPYTRILGCNIAGHYTVAAIDASTASNAVVALLIRDLVAVNTDTAAGFVYKGHASSQNVLANSQFGGNKNNVEPVNTVTASWTLGTSGVDLPAANTIPSPAVGAFS